MHFPCAKMLIKGNYGWGSPLCAIVLVKQGMRQNDRNKKKPRRKGEVFKNMLITVHRAGQLPGCVENRATREQVQTVYDLSAKMPAEPPEVPSKVTLKLRETGASKGRDEESKVGGHDSRVRNPPLHGAGRERGAVRGCPVARHFQLGGRCVIIPERYTSGPYAA